MRPRAVCRIRRPQDASSVRQQREAGLRVGLEREVSAPWCRGVASETRRISTRGEVLGRRTRARGSVRERGSARERAVARGSARERAGAFFPKLRRLSCLSCVDLKNRRSHFGTMMII